MKKLTVVLSLTLAITVVLIFAAGCTSPWQKKAAEETMERAIEKSSGEDVEVDSTEESTTISTDEGETTWGQAEIPENFPGDVPIYPGAEATFTYVGSGQDEESATASLETSDSVDKVADWYKTEIDNNGWTIDNTDTWGDGNDKYISYTASQDGRELSVGVSSSETITMITIAVYKDTGTNI
ncbi:hypothetical protein ACFL0Z_02515 [Patescibacteria group bacterium]